MIDRFGESALVSSTDRADPPAGVIDDTVLDRAIEDAEGEINGYLAARYALPLATVPVVLKRWACDLAYYFLLGDAAGENVTKRYESVIKSLRMVNAGELTLGADSSSAGPNGINVAPGMKTNSCRTPRTFGSPMLAAVAPRTTAAPARNTAPTS